MYTHLYDDSQSRLFLYADDHDQSSKEMQDLCNLLFKSSLNICSTKCEVIHHVYFNFNPCMNFILFFLKKKKQLVY